MIRFPTAQELEQGYAAYEAEMATRRAHPIAAEIRDCDLRELDPPPSIEERVYCPQCGKRFDHENRQIARMTRGRHLKAEHPEQIDAT